MYHIIFSFCKTESLFWEFDSCLSVRIPYILELILVRSDDRYIRSLQIIFIPRNKPYILKHTSVPYHQAIFTAPTYHITYRAIYYFHHTVPSYHTDIPYHIPCHTTHNAIPYRTTYHTRQYHTIHTIPNQKYPH